VSKSAQGWPFWHASIQLIAAIARTSASPLIGRTRAIPEVGSWIMKLEIEKRETQGIVVLDLKGRITLGEEDQVLRQRLGVLLATGHNRVILNVKGVSDIDTAALGTLVFYARRYSEAGGKLVLLHLHDAHTKLSDMLRLNAAFETYGDEVEAINSFFPERAVSHYDILDFVEEQERKR
jgi:anti-sigma B factor antagonist